MKPCDNIKDITIEAEEKMSKILEEVRAKIGTSKIVLIAKNERVIPEITIRIEI